MIQSLNEKIIICFSVFSCLIFFLFTTISFDFIQENTKEEYVANNQKILQLTMENVQDFITQMDAISLSFLSDQEFMSILEVEIDTIEANNKIEEKVKSVIYSSAFIEEIGVYIPYKKEMLKVYKSEKNLEKSQIFDLASEKWYVQEENLNHNRTILDHYAYDVNNKEYFTVYRSLINIYNGKSLGIIILTINKDHINKILGKSLINPKESCGILVDDKLFALSGSSIHQNGMFDYIVKSDKRVIMFHNEFSIISSSFDEMEWMIFKMIPVEFLQQTAKIHRVFMNRLAIVFILIFVIVTIVISRRLTKSLKEVTKSLIEFGNGNLTIQSKINSNDEVGKIANAFNRMSCQINELINNQYKYEIISKDANIKALEAQINPHFLYNSLQVISTEALLSKNDKINKMIISLGNSLRYAISYKKMVTVNEEISHVEDYMLLQKARFGSRVHVNYDIDENMLAFEIPKLTVLTLIENSIIHGVEKSMGTCIITVKIKRLSGKIKISVQDDGGGITNARLEELKEDLTNISTITDYKNSIGLCNLVLRYKLLYGDKVLINVNNCIPSGFFVELQVDVEDEYFV